MVVWPADATAPGAVQQPTVWEEARFDVSGAWMATLVESEVTTLWIGRPDRVDTESRVPDVSGYVWHASEPGRIAWVDESGTIVEAALTTDGLRIQAERRNEETGTLVHWDSDGFVFSRPGPQTMFLDTDLRPVSTMPGRFLGVLPGGRALLEMNEILAVARDDPGVFNRLDWLDQGERLSAFTVERSDGLTAAITETSIGSRRLWVREASGSTVLSEPTTAATLAWSGDGRFLIAATGEGIDGSLTIFDTADASLQVIPIGGSIGALGTT
jgi:hypothetical protein